MVGILDIANIVFAVGSILFTVALLPTLYSRLSAVPASTSMLTAGVLWAYVGVYAMLGLEFAMIAGASTALVWTLILIFCRPTAEYPGDGRM